MAEQPIPPVPERFAEDFFLASVFYGARLAGVDSPARAFFLIQKGKAFGLDAATSVEKIAVDPKTAKVVVPVQLFLAEFRKRDGDWKIEVFTVEEVRIRFTQGDREPHVQAYTSEDEKRAFLGVRDTHKAYPKQMMQWRCFAHGLRAYDPESTHGCYAKEEFEEGHEKALPTPASSGLAARASAAKANLTPAPSASYTAKALSAYAESGEAGPIPTDVPPPGLPSSAAKAALAPPTPPSATEKAPAAGGDGPISAPEAQGSTPTPAPPQIASQALPASAAGRCNLDHLLGVAEAACLEGGVPRPVLERKWLEFQGKENGEALASAWIDAITPKERRTPVPDAPRPPAEAGVDPSEVRTLHGWIRSASPKKGADGHESTHWIGGLLRPKGPDHGIPAGAIHPTYGSCGWEARLPKDEEPPAGLVKGAEVLLSGPGWVQWKPERWEFKATAIEILAAPNR